jgi:hypothetical protein
MSLGRLFLINELRRLEMRFHPDNSGDEQAIEYIRAAIQALAPPSARKPETAMPLQLGAKAS